ncbi:MAG: phosphoglycolate phosphatase [Terriglobia bacterium]|nr:MAG: phosphoglycolate phosphatase [Terriglobia bacterium]
MDLLIFDLDGTLIDSKQDLALSVNATRAHMRMAPLDIGQISSYVGSGAPILIRRALGAEATEAQIEESLEFFLEYYREHKLDHTRLYPGVQESLDRLRAAGKRLAVLTNKPVAPSRGIVEGLGLSEHFFRVYGGNSFDFKKPHPIGVTTLMAEAGVERAATMMVGDSGVDVQTARNASVQSCGVTYGFAPETLLDPAPDLLVDDLRKLADWALQSGSASG